MNSSAYRELITSALSHAREQALRKPAFFAHRTLDLPKPEPQPIKAPEPKKASIALEPIQRTAPSAPSSKLEALGITTIQPPSDQMAKHVKESWRQLSLAPVIAVILGPESGLVKELLINLSKAINTLIAPCRAIPASKIDPSVFLTAAELKLVIAPDTALTGQLLTYLKEIPGQSKRFLNDKPLLLLPDPNIYLKDPMLKSALWKSVLHSF
ncbi:MAG: hypothetical protein KDK50_03340 [Chlamydiia bacterium]|nr:hypothetical protein [Chlamydiia bacterium]MCP5491608.1 hypothetical protein [Chlamydiales bacterium]